MKTKPIFLIILMLVSLLVSQNQFVCSQEADSIDKIKLQATLTPAYVIGPGDQITVIDRTLRELFGQVERYDLVVSTDGFISVPLPNGAQKNIIAAGLTLDELSVEVRKLFGQTLKNPLVFLQISRYRPINIYIGGAIMKPGFYKIESTTTQEEGKTSTTTINTFGLSLTQAIQLAGGLRPRADIRKISVTKGISLNKKNVDLKQIITGENTTEDINLQPGDAVFIPDTDNIEDQAQTHVLLLGKLAYQQIPVNITGEVKKIGTYLLPNDSTIINAIGNAGGANEVGSLKKIKLSRFDADGIYRIREINVHELLKRGTTFDDIVLRPNDNLEFVASKGKEVRHFFRDISNVILASIIGTIGSYTVQDNLLNRIKRGGAGSINQAGGGAPNLTIFTTPAPLSDSE